MKNPENRPSKAASKRVRVFGVLFALGLPALIALGGYFIWSADSPTSPPPNQADALGEDASEEDASDDPAAAGEDAGVTYLKWKGRESGQAAPLRRVDDEPRWVVVRPDILEESAPAADPEDAGTWADPVNQRVLGPKSWMAEVSPAETEALERVLNAPRPAPRYPIDLRVRQWSADIAAEVVELCFGESQPRGRFAVNYRLVADGRRAIFEDIHLTNIYGLDDPVFVDAFVGCVVESLGERSFRSSEEGQMQVARPFLFDGTRQQDTRILP